ncbi:MAG: hypothetical protein ACHQFX_10405 [Chitinophagales bacterium]
MTPELKTACEVVFQEHKVSPQPIKWNSDTFRGRISLGLSDLAKDTLVKKNIIILPNKSKKILTLLNPAVATAASFEEAEDIIQNKRQVPKVDLPVSQPIYLPSRLSNVDIPQPSYSSPRLSVASNSNVVTPSADIKWYMKPVFFYVIWPLCAAIAGAVISFLLDFAYTELFLDWK